MGFFKDDLKWNFEAKNSFRVINVGADIAGLAAGIGLKRAGHDVVILEQVQQLGEVGAGIQMAPNAARILGRFGLLEKIMKSANIMEQNSLRRWQNNEEVGTAPLMPQIGDKYKAPLSVIHRGDLQRILVEGVYAEKVDVRLKHRVVKADPDFKARVQVESGEWIEGDVVIAADGIKSDIRYQMASRHGVKDHSTSTGDAAYCVIIPREKMQQDKRALELLDSNIDMRWMGPGGHIMAYPIKNNNVYNMVLLHPQKARCRKHGVLDEQRRQERDDGFLQRLERPRTRPPLIRPQGRNK